MDELVHSAQTEMKIKDKQNQKFRNASSIKNGVSINPEEYSSSFNNLPVKQAAESNFTFHNSKLHLGLDLCGETSDFNTHTNNSLLSDSEMYFPSEISRKKITALHAINCQIDEPDSADATDNEVDWESSCSKTDVKKKNNAKKSVMESIKPSNANHFDTMSINEEKIQPDILDAIPSKLFHKSFVEAHSSVYDDAEYSGERVSSIRNRRRHASEDNLTSISKDIPIFVHPTLHHPNLKGNLLGNRHPFSLDWSASHRYAIDQNETSIEDSTQLDALQIGDVFSFPGQLSQVRDVGQLGKTTRKNKQDQLNNLKSISKLIPGFLKSFNNSNASSSKDSTFKSRNSEYDTSANYMLMEDYRQHFHAQQQPLHSTYSRSSERIETMTSSSELWPINYPAFPFRNIRLQYNVDTKNSRGCDNSRKSDSNILRDPLPSPIQLSRKRHSKKFTKLIGQDSSGLY